MLNLVNHISATAAAYGESVIYIVLLLSYDCSIWCLVFKMLGDLAALVMLCCLLISKLFAMHIYRGQYLLVIPFLFNVTLSFIKFLEVLFISHEGEPVATSIHVSVLKQ